MEKNKHNIFTKITLVLNFARKSESGHRPVGPASTLIPRYPGAREYPYCRKRYYSGKPEKVLWMACFRRRKSLSF